jgi:hypothetical protein
MMALARRASCQLPAQPFELSCPHISQRRAGPRSRLHDDAAVADQEQGRVPDTTHADQTTWRARRPRRIFALCPLRFIFFSPLILLPMAYVCPPLAIIKGEPRPSGERTDLRTIAFSLDTHHSQRLGSRSPSLDMLVFAPIRALELGHIVTPTGDWTRVLRMPRTSINRVLCPLS